MCLCILNKTCAGEKQDQFTCTVKTFAFLTHGEESTKNVYCVAFLLFIKYMKNRGQLAQRENANFIKFSSLDCHLNSAAYGRIFFVT